MSHFKVSLRGHPNSYALLSRSRLRETAVIFVHGFIGDAADTWIDFQTLVDEPESDWWNSSDLFFYDYSTTAFNIAVQSARFRVFLNKIFPQPVKDLAAYPSPELTEQFGLRTEDIELASEYRRLVLVGHSLGGVVIREAIVDAAIDYENNQRSVFRTTMLERPPAAFQWLEGTIRLFAPAVFGFAPRQFAGFCYQLAAELPRLGRFLKPVLKSNPVHEELQADSERLLDLRRRTEALAAKFEWMESLRGHLIFGAKENIVYMDRYDCDPVYEIIEGHDHRSICKPNRLYRKPLEFVSYERSKPASV